MPGRSSRPRSGNSLRKRVAALGRDLGLDARTEVRVGRRIWGAERSIDVVLTHRETRLSIGIECKAPETAGSAEEKISAARLLRCRCRVEMRRPVRARTVS